MDALPLVLLGIRTTLKEDIGCTAAELVYGGFFSPQAADASLDPNTLRRQTLEQQDTVSVDRLKPSHLDTPPHNPPAPPVQTHIDMPLHNPPVPHVQPHTDTLAPADLPTQTTRLGHHVH